VSPAQGGNPYAGGSIGLATLRRDGFASMDGPGIPMPAITHTGARDRNAGELPPGELITRPIVFSGGRLFVNARVPAGALTVEVLQADGSSFPGFSAADCVPVTGDSTAHPVTWRAADLSRLARTPVRLRFLLGAGGLYSFWIDA
jgi:hypothetical protein